jgi:5S rRNA maturation endonuclease (ribonuclease M5)
MSNAEVEEFEEWLDELKTETAPVIVEGESDQIALEKLGVKNVSAIARKPLDRFTETISADEVILLLDYDAEGKKLTKELCKIFQRNKIKCNLGYWKMLPRFKLSHVEGIFKRFNKLQNRK